MKSNVLAAVLFAAAATALPARAGWYGGFSVGESRTGGELVSNRESTVTLAGDFHTEFSDRDVALKAMLGYEVRSWLAFELDYVDLGKHSLRSQFLGGDPPSPAEIFLEREVRGIGADAVFFLPIARQWQGFARIGVMRAELKARQALDGNVVFTNGDPSQRSRSATMRETVLRYGLGMQWELEHCHLLRLEWQRSEKIGKAFEIGGSGTTGEADTDAVFVGYVYRFGF